MIRIGLTGTLGAGKSVVGRLFEGWGAWRIDADELAREAVDPGSPALERIREAWGDAVLDAVGGLDRAAMRRLVAGDAEARARLEAIVHPEVRRLRRERLAEAAAAGARVTVEEVPLLFEVGLEGEYDAIVVVDAPHELRRERVAAARGVPAGEFEAMAAAQWPPEAKRERADHVVWNDGSLEELEAKARAVWAAVAGTAAAEAPGPWSVDLHMHTRASHDCLSAPEDVVRRAREVGLDRIAVTDHNEVDGALAAREVDPELVIVAEEVRTAEGPDLIGLFIERRIPRGVRFRDAAAAIRDQGGVVYLPHPFDRYRGVDEAFLDEVVGCVDLVEGFNARVHDPARNRRAREWAATRGLPLGAGSDAHLLGEIGRGRVRLPPFDGPGALLRSAAAGTIEGEASGWWVHLGSTWAKLRKKLPV